VKEKIYTIVSSKGMSTRGRECCFLRVLNR
jgi:hypothetical protein